jgi:light-regulated signal transduction histidine kinase (bacteriophytochrome)
MSNQDLPFALMRWIKKNQEEIQSHKEKMALKNYQEDKEYARLMSFIVQEWPSLKTFERLMILRLTEQHANFRVMSPAQRSVITAMWIRHCA